MERVNLAQVAGTRICRAGAGTCRDVQVQVELGAGQPWDKNFFVHVTEC